jgi:hypothetical protein
VLITFTCPCGKKLQMPEQYAGKKGKCPTCGSVVDIPLPSALDEEPVVADLIEAAPARDNGPPRHDVRDRDRDYPREGQPEPRLEDLPNHNEERLPGDVDFFATPPRDIGPLTSAYSTLRQCIEPTPAGTRTAWMLGAGGGGLLLGVILVALTQVMFLIVVALFLAVLGGALAWHFTRFRHRCTFVGRDGVARYRCQGHRDNVTEDVFLFRDATELRIGQTRHYVNGAYTGTNYAFNWTDVNRYKVFSLTGTFHSEVGTPVAKDPFYFATAAEVAWSVYLLDNVQAQLSSGGSIKFGLKGGDSIRVGPGFLLLEMGGDRIKLEGDDIANVRIDQGVVSIREPGAKEGWFSSTGVHKFNYNELANAQFFLFLMDRLVGVRANG